ncbi:MAG TPA: hypothetical protein VE669_06955, partial [Actinomycetota bacterium]|nr:hypothetical protein [Actinomycetota bacterium]
MARRPSRTARLISPIALLVALAALPASSAPKGRAVDADALAHVSQSVAIRYWMAHPNQAPDPLKDVFREANLVVAGVGGARAGALPVVSDVFTADAFGFPQNEESVSGCRLDEDLVIQGTNDYRVVLDTEGNFTGWHLSTDGGSTLAKEGLLPPVADGGTATRPSGGDPVFSFSESDCDVYAGSLNYDPVDPFANTNGVGIYKTDVATLLSGSCDPDQLSDLSDEDCWPTRRYAAFSNDPTH